MTPTVIVLIIALVLLVALIVWSTRKVRTEGGDLFCGLAEVLCSVDWGSSDSDWSGDGGGFSGGGSDGGWDD